MNNPHELDELYPVVFDIINSHIGEYYTDTLIQIYRGSVYDRWIIPGDTYCLIYVDKTSNIFYARKKFRKRKLLSDQLKLLGLKEFTA